MHPHEGVCVMVGGGVGEECRVPRGYTGAQLYTYVVGGREQTWGVRMWSESS